MKFKILLFCLFFWSNLSANNDQLNITALPDSAINLRPYLQIFTDETNTMTREKVQQRQQSGAFQPFDDYEFKSVLERGKYTYWFYLAVDYLPKEKEEVILRGFGGVTLELFHFKEGQLINKVLGGTLTPATDTAQIAYYKSDLPIILPSGESVFLIKYTNTPTHYLASNNIRLIKATTGLHANDKRWITYYTRIGLFIGGLLFVLLSTIAQYFQVKDKAFLFYAIYVLSLLVYYWRSFALDNPFFRIMPPAATATEYFTLFNLPIYFTYLLFLRAFIGDKTAFPRLQQAIKLFMGAIITYFIIERTAMYFSLNWAYRVEKFGRPLFLIFGLGLLFSLIRTNSKGPIKYILYGTLSLVVMILLGLLISFFSTSFYWYSFNITNDLTQIGILLELVCFSLALGAKAKIIEQEKIASKLALQIQQKESEHLKELDQIKSRFFTNITHEFRTPLTVIQGINQQIKTNPNKDLNRRTALIQSNVDNLLDMVNQLLDLSKTDFNQYTIKNTQQDIIKYLSYLTDSFHSLAYDKKINLSFHSTVDQQLMDFDPKIIQTLTTNLVGNALKFTPEYGKIKVLANVLSVEDNRSSLTANSSPNSLSLNFEKALKLNDHRDFSTYLSLKITDTGNGIPKQHLPYIFDRFYQADATDKKSAYGTGIGLALIKELMELLGGAIQVTSEEQTGSTFELFLPIRNQAILETSSSNAIEINKNGTAASDQITAQTPTESVFNKTISPSKIEKPLLLIVEDNADVVYYLKDCLLESYEVLVAQNGKEGVTLAFQQIPDLILSDVMMPEMDGYELCEQLKNDTRTSHIPIVLLTAKMGNDSKYKGFESGADAYLAKPFDKKELLLRLENLALLKQQMQLHLQLNSQLNSSKNIVTSILATKELAFLQQLRSAVLQQLHHDYFKTPQLAKAMLMSQTQLYRKIKALTNQSTAQYIKTVRLEKAKKLLETTDLSIGQIATEVGFKTHAYFSRAFQEEYDLLPSNVRK